MGSNLSAVKVAQEHGLDEKQTEELQRLVLKHLLKCSAANLPKGMDDEDYQGQLDHLIEAASGPVSKAFEDYLRRQLSELEAKATA